MNNIDYLHYVITAQEASTIWGLSRNAINIACNQGRLRGRKSGQTWLVSLSDMIAYKKGAHIPSKIPDELKPAFKAVLDDFNSQ